jgi:hypothetical protein
MMKKKLLAAAAAIVACVCAAEEAKTSGAPKKALKLLMIGNSFSISCYRQMPQVAQALGLELDICSLYIGGCSLQQHMKNVTAAADPAFAPYRLARSVNGRKVTVPAGKPGANANIPQTLAADKWDVVTIQQVSHESWQPATFSPAGDLLVKTIRERAPGAEIVVQETWSYTPWDKRLAKWKMDQNEMYAKLHAAYAAFAAKYGFRVIPMGTAVQQWRARRPVRYTENSFGGDVVGGGHLPPERHFRQKDGRWVPASDRFHLNTAGEYYQALLWTAFLFKVDVTPCTYRPASVSAADADLMKRIVMDLVRADAK